MLRIYGDATLSRKSAPVGEIDDETVELANDMLDTMYEYDGIGLAAPQIGVNTRLIVLDVPMPKPGKSGAPPRLSPGEALLVPRMPMAFVNPEFVACPGDEDEVEEGCLSLPGIHADVTRPSTGDFKARLLDGAKVSVRCGGLLARAIQHEIDHLEGIVFVERLAQDEFKKVKDKIDKLKRGAGKKGFLRRLFEKEDGKNDELL